jgi:type II secretory pathway component PulC
MKNKKVVYFLIFVVLLIWGIIFYRIFSTVGSENNTSYPNNEVKKETGKAASDTFTIDGNYRDPFLGTIQVERPPAKPVSIAKVLTKDPAVVQILPWPSLVFGGMIKNQKSNKQLVLLQINGQNNLMKTGDLLDGIQLVKVAKDSILVSFQKGKKWIRK